MSKGRHHELCLIAAKWLKNKCHYKCPVTAVELVAAGQSCIPDVIGFNSDCSIFVEVKISRSDFLRDKKKFQHLHPNLGLGNFRLYCAPWGLINPNELPEKWGLIEIDENNKVVNIIDPTKGRDVYYKKINRFESNINQERWMMYSLLRRNKISL